MDEWYSSLLKNAQVRIGNNRRLLNVIGQAKAGKEITIAVIGGSITEGAGAAKYAECWASRFADAFRKEYGCRFGANVRLVNAGVGGTPSTFGWMRYQREVLDRVFDEDGLPDLVIVEYAVNDGEEPTNHGCYESMVRSILSAPNKPAVMLLFSVFPTGYTLQDDFIPIGNAYDLTMISMKNSAFPYIGDKWTKEEFFFDIFHPTSAGHQVMADCIMAAVRAGAEKAPDPADIDPEAVTPVYSADYCNITRVLRGAVPEGIGFSAGGFDTDDTGAYANFPIGRVCGRNFSHTPASTDTPMTFTAVFGRLLVAHRAYGEASDDQGAAEVLIDGRKVFKMEAVVKAGWGQSDTKLVFTAPVPAEHKVEIRMAPGDEAKNFTVTGIAYC